MRSIRSLPSSVLKRRYENGRLLRTRLCSHGLGDPLERNGIVFLVFFSHSFPFDSSRVLRNLLAPIRCYSTRETSVCELSIFIYPTMLLLALFLRLFFAVLHFFPFFFALALSLSPVCSRCEPVGNATARHCHRRFPPCFLLASTQTENETRKRRNSRPSCRDENELHRSPARFLLSLVFSSSRYFSHRFSSHEQLKQWQDAAIERSSSSRNLLCSPLQQRKAGGEREKARGEWHWNFLADSHSSLDHALASKQASQLFYLFN